MTTFTGSDDLRGAEFVDTDLSRARFVGADLSGVVMRGVQVDGADIDAPWLLSDGGSLLVNGVDVTPYVDAELNRRFPGRAEQRAEDPEGLRVAWAALERTWAATLERVAAMPDGTVDVSVDGEWSFAQTLRHLVLATDMWLGKAVLEIEQPFHPLGLLDAGSEADGTYAPMPAAAAPSYDEVLEARAGRVAMVRDFLATVTPDQLAEERATRTIPRTPRPPSRVCTRSWRRSGSTTGTPSATSRRSRRGPPGEPGHVHACWAAAYSSSVTASSQVVGSASPPAVTIATWLMHVVAVPPCQCSSPAPMVTVSPGRMRATEPSRLATRPTPSVT